MADTTNNKTETSNSKPKRPRQPRKWWEKHYQAWQKSGLSKKQYCANHGITPSSFFNWVSKLEKVLTSQDAPAIPVKFIRADVTPNIMPSQVMSLAVGDVRVFFDSGVPASGINQWITTLRSSQC